MKTEQFTPNPRTAANDAKNEMRGLIHEALTKQAALRPAVTPPRQMPVTPVLPRQPKPHKRRGR